MDQKGFDVNTDTGQVMFDIVNDVVQLFNQKVYSEDNYIWTVLKTC